jgi:hypothetical protein
MDRSLTRLRSLLGLSAGSGIFVAAFTAVIRAPTAFFDTTPLGRMRLPLITSNDAHR